jgi:hypothetical protein
MDALKTLAPCAPPDSGAHFVAEYGIRPKKSGIIPGKSYWRSHRIEKNF